MPAEDRVVVGRVGAPHGVRGWLHVQSYTSPIDNLLNYGPWQLRGRDGVWRTVTLAGCRAHKQAFVAKFENVDDRDAAGELSGALIGVPREALPAAEDDEFYWRDLEGCAVVNNTGNALGEVAGLLETGAHDVLVVKADGGEILIPFTAGYVLAVDMAARLVTVDWQADW